MRLIERRRRWVVETPETEGFIGTGAGEEGGVRTEGEVENASMVGAKFSDLVECGIAPDRD